MEQTSVSKPRAWRDLGARVSMVVPAVLVYVALLVVPVIYAIYYSFTEYNGFPHRVPEFIGLDNYRTMFGSDDITGTMVVTAVVAVVGAVAVNLAALGDRKSVV